MDLGLSLIIAVGGYLVGSISFARLVGKLALPEEDLERSRVEVDGADESFSFRTVSATTLRARAGRRYGIAVSVLDFAKAALPVAVVASGLASQAYAFLLSLCIILGHDFPIYYRFRGGRGVSCLLGSLIFFDWTAIPAALALSLGIGLLVIDDAFIAFIAMPVYLVPWTLLTAGTGLFFAYAVAVNVIYWVALRPELREYLRFRRTDAYAKAKKARHERMKKGLSRILNKLGATRR